MINSEILKFLDAPTQRLPLPAAHADPAFRRCLEDACSSQELIENFDRLTGCRVSSIATGSAIERMIDEASGFRDDQLRQFSEFVHEWVYLRLPYQAIHSLRLIACQTGIQADQR